MRIAPVGLLARETDAFVLGAQIAALTHGHPSGDLAAGFLALAIRRACDGDGLNSALDQATAALRTHIGHEQTLEAVSAARRLAAAGPPSPARVESLGDGWVAEEALAIGVYSGGKRLRV